MNWTVGDVLSKTYSVAMANFTAFYGTALIITAPLIISDLIGVPAIDVVINAVCLAMMGICGTYGTFRAMTGNKPDIAAMISRINRPGLLMLIVLGVVQGIGIGIGIVLLILPGLFLLGIWAVAQPAMIIERTDIGASFTRSRVLTEGRRLRVIGTIVLVAVIAMIAVAIPLFFVNLLFEWAGSLVLSIAGWAIGGIYMAFTAPLLPLLYFLLRQEKEGATIEQIAVQACVREPLTGRAHRRGAEASAFELGGDLVRWSAPSFSCRSKK